MTNDGFFNTRQNFCLVRLKAITDNRLKVAQGRCMFLIRVENILEKEKMEITRIFSFSHYVFQKVFLLRVNKTWYLPNERQISCFEKHLTLSSIYTHFNTLEKKALGKHCG